MSNFESASSQARKPRRLEYLALFAVVLLFVVAPTPGDIGGCGQSSEQLKATTFFHSKRVLECRRCHECDVAFQYCVDACDDSLAVPDSFALGCFPLVHDGDVCLRAIEHASCSTFMDYVHDDPRLRSSPTECNFCPF